jgi:2-phospho-L-lactate transferase/gluconeogenesis factor (CofD/UPF0052 family)
MNVNKKLGRFRQFVGEKLGNENKTGVSDDFKAMEMEMQLRHEGETSALADRPLANETARNGQDAEVHDDICEVALQARRG